MIETLGNKLKKLRLKKNLKQEQVANKIGVERSAISAYENDKRQPSYSSLVQLALMYGVSTDYLLGIQEFESADFSSLTPKDLTAIKNIVEILSEKNKELAEYKKMEEE